MPVVLMEDSAALAGLLVALAAVLMTEFTGWYGWDAIGSIVIGVILCGVSLLLAKETHSLLIGEVASIEDRKAITDMVIADEDVEDLPQLITVHRSAEDLLVAMKVRFRPGLTLETLEDVIDRIEDRVREKLPKVGPMYVEPDSDYEASEDPHYYG